MKKALLGLSNNISSNLDKIKVWANSFHKYCNDDVILLAANASQEEIKLCKDINIKTVSVNIEDTHRIYHKRLEKILFFLQQSDIDLFLITDVFDVVFQNNPFDKLDTNIYDVFVAGEGIDIKHEPWNSDNINKLFPQHIHKCLDKEVICSGIIAGKRTSLCNLYQLMFDFCENSTNNHNIQDQAALIVLIYDNRVPNLKVFNLDESWAVHCAVAGPTQFFDSWGFRKNIKYTIPHISDGTIYSANNKFDIVHQFNRINEWNEILTKPYID